jgi:prepilin-type N-terminal cleavage/methylation domain-containing protein
MNKKGFTLVEIIAVIVIVALILAIAVPRVLDQFAGYRGDLSDKQIDLVIEAARQYVNENLGSFPEGTPATPNTVCCLSIEYLVCRGAVFGPLANDINTANAGNKVVRVHHDSKKHTITVVDSCAPAHCHNRTCP